MFALSLQAMEELEITQSNPGAYSDDAVVTLDWKEHIRLRPGMYIGKLGEIGRASCRERG